MSTMAQKVLAQQNISDFDHSLLLETKSDTTANVSFGDFDGDGHLDILLVKGRHWSIVDRVLLGDGKGGIRKAYNLGAIADRSYTGGLADFNGDGFLDIAVSNDAPDRKLVYFNDGKGNFTVGSEFGLPEWPTRNLSIADINGDGWPDLILANRGRPSRPRPIPSPAVAPRSRVPRSGAGFGRRGSGAGVAVAIHHGRRTFIMPRRA